MRSRGGSVGGSTALLRGLALAILVAGCRGVAGPPTLDGPPGAALRTPDSLEERALLLLLVDRQLYDGFSARRSLALGPGMRLAAARSIGQTNDAGGRNALEDLVLDADLEVRRQAVFSLGVLGDSAAAQALLRASRDPDRETGVLAVESLAKLETPIATVLRGLEGVGDGELWPRLAPSLFRFPIEEALPVVRRALIEGGSAVYRDAIYALARNGEAEVGPILRDLLADPDPWLRGWAARALGRVGEGDDVEALVPLADGADAGAAIQALRSVRRLVSSGALAPPESWRPRLLRLMEDSRPGVRLTAIETSGAWQRDDPLGAALVERFATATGRERELALLALAASGHPRIAEWVATAAAADDRGLRRTAAAAAALAGLDAVLESLFGDPEAAVRSAALGELLRRHGESALPWAQRGLADADPVVRATAFDWATDHPQVPVVALLAALAEMGVTDLVETQASALAAVRARAAGNPSETEMAVAALELLAGEGDPVLARRAAGELEALGETPPSPPPAAPDRGVAVYRAIALQAAQGGTVRLSTDVGEIDIQLDCEGAPLTCVSFLQLVNQRFYDGLTFHRVVHDFVLQAGDPRGDGYGGPGYMIRDEINRSRYRRGSVGMALSGPDSGGSQFFIALSPQPHLDGGYTVFGQVVRGDEVLDRVVQGAVLRQVRQLEDSR